MNTDHLFLGTKLDNTADMVAKRRQSYGERNGSAKLSLGQVRDIRAARRDGVAMAALADRHGVHYSTIYKVLTKETWCLE